MTDNRIEQIDRRLAELREHSVPGEFDWDDVEYLNLIAEKLSFAVPMSFNSLWFRQMADKLRCTLDALDRSSRAAELFRKASLQSHSDHFMGSDAGCPECIRAMTLRTKAHAILRGEA